MDLERSSELITDAGTGLLSHSKLWANVAYAAATAAFLYAAWKGTLAADVWMIYLGVVASNATVSKAISLKWGGPAVPGPAIR